MDYEQKYKEALDRADTLMKKEGKKLNVIPICKYIFPEFDTVSEDERIRKVLLNDFKNNCSEYYCDGVNRDMIINWLEKQGEQKPTEDAKKLGINKVINWINPDKVIEWLKNTIKETEERFGYNDIYKETRLTLPYDSIEDFINDFKEDFGLC